MGSKPTRCMYNLSIKKYFISTYKFDELKNQIGGSHGDNCLWEVKCLLSMTETNKTTQDATFNDKSSSSIHGKELNFISWKRL